MLHYNYLILILLPFLDQLDIIKYPNNPKYVKNTGNRTRDNCEQVCCPTSVLANKCTGEQVYRLVLSRLKVDWNRFLLPKQN